MGVRNAVPVPQDKVSEKEEGPLAGKVATDTSTSSPGLRGDGQAKRSFSVAAL